jgi:Flp pilus assembly protein TadD
VRRGAHWLASFLLALGCGVAPSQAKQSSVASSDPFQQGLVSLQENRPAAALDAFTVAETKMPSDARVRNFRGIALTALGRTEEASNEYRRAIELDPKLQSAYRNLGFLEWTAHQPENARGHLEKALALDANDDFSRYYLARVEAEGAQFEQALTLFKQIAVGHLDDRPWAQLNLALAYLYAGKYEDAVGTAKAFGDRSPKNALPYVASGYSIIGIANARERHNEQSITALRQAAAMAPQAEEHWLNLTRQLMDVNRFAEAVAAVQEGLRSNPTSYALRLRLGAAYFSSGKYLEAEQTFRELVNAGDPLPMSYIGLAQVLLHTGRATDAATELAAAEQRLGPQFLVIYFRGLALGRAGQRADALAAFKKAVLMNPESADAHLGCGKTALALGDLAEAVKELRRVLELDPQNVPARRLLGQAYARLGDRENAVKYTASVPDTEPEPRTNLVGDFILPDWQQPALP